MLWQGQELAENYTIPDSGEDRISIERGMDWELFYDDEGQALVKLYRRLGVLRRTLIPALRSRTSFYYDAESRLSDGVVAYPRESATRSRSSGCPSRPLVPTKRWLSSRPVRRLMAGSRSSK
jgi:hypothetical protein